MKNLKKMIPMLLLALVLVAGITLLGPKALATESDIFVDDYVYGDNYLDGFTIDLVDEGAIIYDYYDWNASDIYVPHTLDGYPVVGIADNAFSYFTQLESIFLPSSITYIGEYAFSDCYSLYYIELPENVTSIAYGTFSWCENLTEIYIPASVQYIDANAFECCDNLSYVYYGGTQAQWNTLMENTWDGNECLAQAEVYCCGWEIPGDMNGDGIASNDDVVLLLWNSLFPEEYPLTANTDLNYDGFTNNDDVVLLLWHTLFPEEYPI